MNDNEQIKASVGREAAKFVLPGMTIGIGSGSTAYWLIAALGERIKEGLECRAVPTSTTTRALAIEHHIPVIELGEVEHVDLAIDGADEIDPQLQLIKGGGGSLLQEKMVADVAQQFIIIADETKMVTRLGKFPLPVEVVAYGWEQTKQKIERLGCKHLSLRMQNGKPLITDHGHYTLDCQFDEILYPATLHSRLNNLPGVVENGLFLNMADTALIGYRDGSMKEFRKVEKSQTDN